MPSIVEYRIPLPFTLEEFERGFRYAIAKTSSEETNGEQGYEILETHGFYDEKMGGAGVYTHGLLRFGDRLPKWVNRVSILNFSFPNLFSRQAAPATAQILDEKTWNSFPFVKTWATNPFFAKLEVGSLVMSK